MARTLRTVLSASALLLAALGMIATSPVEDEDWRYPCNGHDDWDPAEPLYLHFGLEDLLDPDTPGLLEGIRVMDPDGVQAQLVLATAEDGMVVVCPVGGLAPETTYRWAVGPFHESWHHVTPPLWNGATYSEFTTGSGWPGETIDNRAACAAHPLPKGMDESCVPDTAAGG
jgi:hypothetical protein